MQSIKKFLEFNGKNIIFLCKNGIYYIALKPICEAIGVDYIQQFKNTKVDEILKDELCKHTMHVPGDRHREFVCLPEEYIYGWIFSIKSNSPDLIKYKKKCYLVLFEFFHGTITRRKEVLQQVVLDSSEADKLRTILSDNKDYTRLVSLEANIMRAGKSLKKLDSDLITDIQLNLFANNN